MPLQTRGSFGGHARRLLLCARKLANARSETPATIQCREVKFRSFEVTVYDAPVVLVRQVAALVGDLVWLPVISLMLSRPHKFHPLLLAKNEADRCVFLVVWSLLERAIDIIPAAPDSFFGSALPSMRALASPLKFLITGARIRLVLYDFHFIAHRQWELRHLRDRSLCRRGNRRLIFSRTPKSRTPQRHLE